MTATPLRPGELPCAACGVAVSGPHDPSLEEVATGVRPGARGSTSALRNNLLGNDLQMVFTRCSTCAAIRGTAADLLAAFPNESARIGARAIAIHRLEVALDALDALGITEAATIDDLTAGGMRIRTLMEYLTHAGGAARWISKFAPRMEKDARVSTASSGRWAHVTGDQRAALRRAYADLLHARIQRPVDFACPSEEGEPSEGCILCGVATWRALPSQIDHIWTERSSTSQALGGRPSVDRVYGYSCPRCERAIQHAGAVGDRAMQLSLLDLLGVGAMSARVTELEGLIAWAVTSRTAPNGTPWDHVDLTGIRETLTRPGEGVAVLSPR